jgi:hypothetical protein
MRDVSGSGFQGTSFLSSPGNTTDYVDTIIEPLNTKIQHITSTPFATYFTNDVIFRSAAEIVIEPEEGLFLASDIVTITGNQVRVLGDITISNGQYWNKKSRKVQNMPVSPDLPVSFFPKKK